VKHFKNSQQINYSTDRGSSYADRERNYPSCCCSCCCFHLMFIGPCIIVIVEEEETNLMSQFIKFYFTSSMLNMFRTLIHPSSGACDFSIVSPHWSCVLVSMCVGVSVWLVGVVSAWQAEAHGYHPNPATPKLQHTSKQEHTTNVVIQ